MAFGVIPHAAAVGRGESERPAPDEGIRGDAMNFDLGSPWALLSSLLIGLIGFALFLYGKKEPNLKCLGTGVVMCVFPYFVHSVLLMWALAAACLGGLALLSRQS